ncbi:MAG: DUF4097 family beta strand repeat-containing protein [Armatimonadota bacterium]|nr:DUF4097 family beta strand repeat-containing protein [Armatimonadota bacterium]MDR7487682.1 DUF4097 family beta strand repeat-containing protein [Armatimonadota bacterium]MDR7491710.1 DUF4097 family beta strand repeat-containing protein [Armatimonadota bacterium]MDR7575122.1 DUF4097 family beta strand repeat-containing protein [Armatimonadota bacterium]MDR7592351.1 DUF4097 family beta strand repeat-containing protein [Armatimonadota bacterium]
MSDERLRVLRMLREGRLSVEEADALLEALGEAEMPRPDEEAGPGGAGRGEGEASARHTAWPVGADLGERIGETVREALRRARPGLTVARATREALRALREELRREGIGAPDLVRDLSSFSRARRDVDLTAPLGDGGTVRVALPRGDLTVRETAGREVQVHAQVQVWAPGEAASDLLDRIRLEVAPRGQDAVVEVHTPGLQGRYGRVRADLVVEVPAGAPVEAVVGSGDVQVRGAAACELRVKQGDLTVEDVRGRLRVSVVSGTLSVRRLAGDAALQVLRGDVEVTEAAGAVVLEATSGDVAVRRLRGDLDASVRHGDLEVSADEAQRVHLQVVSGDVALDLARLREPGEVSVEVVHGDVEAALGEAAGAVEAEVRSGDLAVDLPLEELRRSRGRVEGRLGSGQGRLRFRITSGDLRLRRRRTGEAL